MTRPRLTLAKAAANALANVLPDGLPRPRPWPKDLFSWAFSFLNPAPKLPGLWAQGPKQLYKALSWGVGQNTSFFSVRLGETWRKYKEILNEPMYTTEKQQLFIVVALEISGGTGETLKY